MSSFKSVTFIVSLSLASGAASGCSRLWNGYEGPAKPKAPASVPATPTVTEDALGKSDGLGPNTPGKGTPAAPGAKDPAQPGQPVAPIDGPKTGLITLDLQKIASDVGHQVDRQIKMDELLKVRKSSHPADACGARSEIKEAQSVRFADQITFAVMRHLPPKKPSFRGIESAYGLATDVNKHTAVSLISQPLCEETRESLTAIMLRKVPSNDTIRDINTFARQVNEARASQNSEEQVRLWSKFFGCLAYVESLTTADKAASVRVARTLLPRGTEKAPGVKYYKDPSQTVAESQLDIGLYQFSPSPSGNVVPCVKEWDKEFSSCKISVKRKAEAAALLGSAEQAFNAYCGVDKIVQTFFVQVNTKEAKRIHPKNRSKGITPENRCVSLNYRSTVGYSHFGPLHNTTGESLGELMSCVVSKE